MILKVVSVRDHKAEEFQGLHLVPNLSVAVRMFGDTAVPDSMIARHPEDYSLVLLAEFNTETGEITPIGRGGKFGDLVIEASALVRQAPRLVEGEVA
nr:MAG: nonstructural protein [Microvirus sp.]